eukprot:TRINITY_DN37793_c0_g1_i1.p1 TRINITY_DN37793_c0_g1~~TRINITY_DN37793_c0_g1_i1.p1  ORF type:complete len:764 (+),score=167.30 TRINITY_DN37793_c0_g1_i1:193-2484(+)
MNVFSPIIPLKSTASLLSISSHIRILRSRADTQLKCLPLTETQVEIQFLPEHRCLTLSEQNKELEPLPHQNSSDEISGDAVLVEGNDNDNDGEEENDNDNDGEEENDNDGRCIVYGPDGIAFKLPEAPFQYQYSYTETPKEKPLKLRENYLPFGPDSMGRPWTGKAPKRPSKKKRPEFDSFKPPPANKKGVKPVQSPGPFLPGQKPKVARSREEILGEPLTKEERLDLIRGCMRSKRQLHIGRDGLTHNMLENIHAHWKRRRVCKIKCLGIPTIDMANICEKLEEKTGGKVIHRQGGVIFLFRGRNYNYKTRQVFPLMLWKPRTPVYPKLIQKAPGGLTIEEADALRAKGRSVPPICTLAKNGVYINLVRDVRDAFEVCELVRIDCQKLKSSDFKKIGAKLKDLVPCVLLSFEDQHLLMWRGKDWKPMEKAEAVTVQARGNSEDHDKVDSGCASFSELGLTHDLKLENDLDCVKDTVMEEVSENVLSFRNVEDAAATKLIAESQTSDEYLDSNVKEDICQDTGSCTLSPPKNEYQAEEDEIDFGKKEHLLATRVQSKCLLDKTPVHGKANVFDTDTSAEGKSLSNASENQIYSSNPNLVSDSEMQPPRAQCTIMETVFIGEDKKYTDVYQNQTLSKAPDLLMDKEDASVTLMPSSASNMKRSSDLNTLWLKAIEDGNLILLNESDLDPDTILQKAIAFAQNAPPGPVFRRSYKSGKLEKKKAKRQKEKRELENNNHEIERKPAAVEDSGGSLPLDELAKLLVP